MENREKKQKCSLNRLSGHDHFFFRIKATMRQTVFQARRKAAGMKYRL
jgi:hypothetical protein